MCKQPKKVKKEEEVYIKFKIPGGKLRHEKSTTLLITQSADASHNMIDAFQSRNMIEMRIFVSFQIRTIIQSTNNMMLRLTHMTTSSLKVRDKHNIMPMYHEIEVHILFSCLRENTKKFKDNALSVDE